MNKKQMIQCQKNLVQQGFLRNEENIKDRVFQFVLAPKGMQWWLLESDRQAYFSDAENIKDQFAVTPNAEEVASALGLHAKRVLRIMYAIDLL